VTIKRKAIPAAVLIFGLSALLAGCGGGSSTTSTTTTTGTTGTTSTTTSTGSTDSTGSLRKIPTPSTLDIKTVDKTVNKYPDQYSVNIGFTPNADTPAFFSDALKKKKPILLEFYAEGDSLSDQMASGIADLQKKYADAAVFILLDSDKPQTYGALSEQLPVQYVPQIFIFNGSATIIRSYTGYVDQDRLDQALYDAVNRGY
jgi:thiol-disulfide isomerase/thioredoxin